MTIDQRQILRRLAELQYKRNDMDFGRGTYRVRGRDRYFSGGIDREACGSTFDDEIEQLSDPLTGGGTSQSSATDGLPKNSLCHCKDRLVNTSMILRLS